MERSRKGSGKAAERSRKGSGKTVKRSRKGSGAAVERSRKGSGKAVERSRNGSGEAVERRRLKAGTIISSQCGESSSLIEAVRAVFPLPSQRTRTKGSDEPVCMPVAATVSVLPSYLPLAGWADVRRERAPASTGMSASGVDRPFESRAWPLARLSVC